MVTVRQLMTSEVVSVSPDLSLREAVELFSGRRIGGAPVTEGEQLVGVLSARDILEFQSGIPGVPTERTEFAAPGPEHTEGRNATEAVEDEDEPVGTYFTELWGDAGASTVARFDASASPEWDLLSEHTVAEAMSRSVRVISPDATVRQAARQMASRQVHRLIVVEERRLIGVLTTFDLVRAIADGRI